MQVLLRAAIILMLVGGAWPASAVVDDKAPKAGEPERERRIQEGEDELRARGRRETRRGDTLGAASPHTLGGPIRVEDCANGGWRTFPRRDFKSQAECISAVRRR